MLNDNECSLDVTEALATWPKRAISPLLEGLTDFG